MKLMARSSRNRAGKEGCPCLDTTSALASLTNRTCALPNGDDGVRIDLDGSCLPYSYGASRCLQHDRFDDPKCQQDDGSGEVVVPSYCFSLWCYVDGVSCSRDSEERVIRSSYFAKDSGLDMFYSYTTCNSTSDNWEQYKSDRVLEGYFFKSIIPDYFSPAMFKRDPNTNETLNETGSEYYDNDVPFEGFYPEYMKRLIDLSSGDIGGINYTHSSRASRILHPTSSFTAAVQDVSDGLADIAIGPFWITGERLKLTAFTIPVVMDKVKLVVPSQELEESFLDQFEKVLSPFTYRLWVAVFLTICYAALLSTLLSNPLANRQRTEQGQRDGVQTKKKYLRLFLDEFLQKGTEFTGAAVCVDCGESLPVKILGFGFGFFILVTVACYVANLAAHLTRVMISGSSITTMEGAVSKGRRICAHPVISEELENAWPKADFYFRTDESGYHGMVDDYEAEECQVLLFGSEDVAGDKAILKRMCDNDLVFTDDIVYEIPIGFPIMPSLSHSLSHWIFEGKQGGDTVKKARIDYMSKRPMDDCNVSHVKLSYVDPEDKDYVKIDLANLVMPFVFFFGCSLLAVAIQLYYMYWEKKGQTPSVLGRRSSFMPRGRPLSLSMDRSSL